MRSCSVSTTCRRTSPASPPRFRIRSTASSAPDESDLDVVSLESANRFAEMPRDLAGLADLHPEQVELAVVFDACEVDVRQVTAVVDDPVRVRVGESDARTRAELERRLLQLWITSSTSSRL